MVANSAKTGRASPDAHLTWSSACPTHEYEPLYLANGTFGGLLDLSGTTMDLWSSSIAARPPSSLPPQPQPLYPVTALRIQAFYRNPLWRKAGFWVGSTGLHGKDPRYLQDPRMPPRPQIYRCRQSLDTSTGLAETHGVLFPGTEAALVADPAGGRAIPFRTRVAFLKDSTLMGIQIEGGEDTDICFLPEPVLLEQFVLRGSAKGIHSVGTDIDCHIELTQKIQECRVVEGRIEYLIEPSGQPPYRVRVTAGSSTAMEFLGRPALTGRGSLFCTVEIVPYAGIPAPEEDGLRSSDDFFRAQARRWQGFWARSDVRLPEKESLWRQRYRTAMFYVAQSLGDGPTHPVGLSRPMLPYWYGCFHDTDTYFCRPLLETGHFETAARHLAFRHRTLATAGRAARSAERSGALFPWQADPEGQGEAADIPLASAIIACEAWHQYLFSGSAAARQQATEVVTGVFRYLCDLVDWDISPLECLPGSHLTFSETIQTEDASEVRLALRAVAAAVLSLCPAGEPLRPMARRILRELDLPLTPEGGYRFGKGAEPDFLRCPSMTLGSFPLHALPADERLRKTFLGELQRVLFQFAWLPHQASVVASQLRQREGTASAAALLRSADVFYKPWHAFDEWENRRAVRAANFVTAAGGFCLAIHAMLLAETEPGVWELFPGIPADWEEAGFDHLHTRAGWKVSASLRGGKVESVSAEPAHAQASDQFVLRFAGRNQTYTKAAAGQSASGAPSDPKLRGVFGHGSR